MYQEKHPHESISYLLAFVIIQQVVCVPIVTNRLSLFGNAVGEYLEDLLSPCRRAT
jgi:hypothetical protein